MFVSLREQLEAMTDRDDVVQQYLQRYHELTQAARWRVWTIGDFLSIVKKEMRKVAM